LLNSHAMPGQACSTWTGLWYMLNWRLDKIATFLGNRLQRPSWCSGRGHVWGRGAELANVQDHGQVCLKM